MYEINTECTRTFNDLIAELNDMASLSARSRTDLMSSTRVVGRGLAFLEAADTTDPLCRPIGTADEIAMRLSSLWRETGAGGCAAKADVSRFRLALRLCGVPVRDGRGNPPLRASWAQLLRRLSEDDRKVLLPFANWASARGLDVWAVGPSPFSAYAAEHLATRTTKSATQQIRKVAAIWARIRAMHALPDIGRPVPHAERDTYCYPNSSFSPRLTSELDALVVRWTTVPRRGRVLQRDVAEQNVYLLRLALSAYCLASSVSLASIGTLAEFLRPEHVTSALEFIIGRAQRSNPDLDKSPQSYQVAHAAVRAAESTAGITSTNAAALRDIARRLSPSAKRELSSRMQATLLPAADPTFAQQLLSLPTVLYAEAGDFARCSGSVRTTLMIACACEMMFSTSLWPCQIARLQPGQDLQRQVDPISGTTTWRVEALLVSPYGARTKTFVIVGASADIITAYVDRVRPQRPNADSAWLFPGRRGRGYHPGCLSQAVARLIRQNLGHRISGKDLADAMAVAMGVANADVDLVVRKFMGRVGTGPDPLIATIQRWRETNSTGRKPL